VGLVGLVRHGQLTSLWTFKKIYFHIFQYNNITLPPWDLLGPPWWLPETTVDQLTTVFYLLLSKPKVLNINIVPDGKVGTR
jgi:hypothetical protein